MSETPPQDGDEPALRKIEEKIAPDREDKLEEQDADLNKAQVELLKEITAGERTKRKWLPVGVVFLMAFTGITFLGAIAMTAMEGFSTLHFHVDDALITHLYEASGIGVFGTLVAGLVKIGRK